MILDRVSFHSHPGTFEVSRYCCDNFECPCTHVTFELRELGSRKQNRPARSPLTIQFRVDVSAWQEVDPPERSPLASEIVTEFLRDYPDSERQLLNKEYENRRCMLDRLRTAVVDPQDVLEGLLLGFRDLFDSGLDPGWLCPLGEYLLNADGTLYLVTEKYCLNPECDCRDVLVTFVHCSPSADPSRSALREHFRVRLSLDGDYELHGMLKVDSSTAQAVFAQWRKEARPQLNKLRWRYDKMKEVGHRSLDAATHVAPHAARASAPPVDERPKPLRRTEERVGRNDPCPCGSGKKYKKCCARSDDPLP